MFLIEDSSWEPIKETDKQRFCMEMMKRLDIQRKKGHAVLRCCVGGVQRRGSSSLQRSQGRIMRVIENEICEIMGLVKLF